MPPKLRPISGSDAFVRFLHRYIATCLGSATDFELFFDLSSVDFQRIVLGDRLLDAFNRDGAVVVLQHVPQHVLGERERDFRPGQRRIRNQADERPLELADVRLDLPGDVDRDVVGQRDPFALRLPLENRGFRLEIRRLDVGNQAPFEPRAQPLFELGNLVRRTVAADDDLLLRVIRAR